MEHGQWRLIPVADCTEKLIAECYMLLCIHFENITLTEFRSDLAEKEMIALLETTAGVRGFSTLMTVTPYVAHARRHIVFSGDTVVDPVYRNSFGLGQCLGRYFKMKLRQLHGQELWYVLISKGFGTYKAMHFLFKRFTPLTNVVDPESVAIGKALCAYKFQHRPL